MEAWKPCLLNTSSLLLRVTFMGKRLGQIDFFCMGRTGIPASMQTISRFTVPFHALNAPVPGDRQHQGAAVGRRPVLRNAARDERTKIIGAHGGLKDVMNAVEQASLESSVLLLEKRGWQEVSPTHP